MIKNRHTYADITSFRNLCEAWQEFVCGKKNKKDVSEFSFALSKNISALHEELKNKTYVHSNYEAFAISDPKPRDIHKASVRDRLLHHAVYRVLYPYFEKKFIFDSYSCRIGKGTHRALGRFRDFARKESRNHTRTCWVLKCDIRKFFASIDHQILFRILERHISDADILWLLKNIIGSFHSAPGKNVQHSVLDKNRSYVGLPLGNLTSQLLVNVYMNEFDQFVKHRLKAKYYIRYADDFVIFSRDKKYLEQLLVKIGDFLKEELKLSLHPDKVFIKTAASGVDFLGWVHFPDHRVLRRATKRRMFRNIAAKQGKEETVASYAGMLSHGNAYKLRASLSLQREVP